MLNLHITQEFPEGCITLIDRYFNRHKKKEWFNREDVKQIIKGIDNTIAVKDEYLESPVYGGMSPDRLSTGCKATILLAVLDNPHIYGTRCGNNCVPYILDIARNKDIAMTLHHCMEFPVSGFEAYIVEKDVIVNTRKDFINEFYSIWG